MTYSFNWKNRAIIDIFRFVYLHMTKYEVFPEGLSKRYLTNQSPVAGLGYHRTEKQLPQTSAATLNYLGVLEVHKIITNHS